jgi:hypothetical protein
VRRVGRILALASALAAIMTLGPSGPAFADPLAGGDSTMKYVRVYSGKGGGGGGSGGGSGCTWKKYAGEIDDSYASPYMVPTYTNLPLGPDGSRPAGEFWWVYCGATHTNLIYVLDSDPYYPPFDLAQAAYDSITGDKPVIHVNPNRALVKLPTWFWAEGGLPTLEATAETINQSATVTAVPKRVIYEISGSSPLTCPYPSTAYNAGVHEPTDRSPSRCDALFTKAREGVRISAYVEYDVTWESTGAVTENGTLPPMEGPDSVEVIDVNEVQTINR